MNVNGSLNVSVVLRRSKSLFLGVGLFSGVINVLALTGAIYMLQVYDRVIPSRSVPTLIGLTILMLVMVIAGGLLEMIRMRIMSRIGLRIDDLLRDQVFYAIQTASLRSRSEGDGLQAVRDLDRVRTFLSGIGPTALFDVPWIPIYLTVIFLLHPMMGWFAVGGAALLIAVTVATEVLSKGPTMRAAKSGSGRYAIFAGSVRNAETVRTMGMAPNVLGRLRAVNDQYLGDQTRASDVVSGLGVISKLLRMLLQSLILGLGAYLVVNNEVSPGSIIAGSIIMSRALAPIEIAIQYWKSFMEARQASHRLQVLLHATEDATKDRTELPAPQSALTVEKLTVAAPGQKTPTISNISFSLNAGEALGVIGPSGSGKSTLARAILGAWEPIRGGGAVRLDGAALDQWAHASLGRHIGYLPQDIQLFEGTVAENIARFNPDATSESIVEAANDAGAHDLIVSLPDGYETMLGDNGSGLSAGQRQRIALARALFGRPFLVVLDEPNASLDSAGDVALSIAIKGIRERGGIAIVIAHRPSALAHIDKVLALAKGQVQTIGPKEEVLRKVLAPVPANTKPAAASENVEPTGVSPIRRSVSPPVLRMESN
jgi:PrtD family type I secretion system ABC transporter